MSRRPTNSRNNSMFMLKLLSRELLFNMDFSLMTKNNHGLTHFYLGEKQLTLVTFCRNALYLDGLFINNALHTINKTSDVCIHSRCEQLKHVVVGCSPKTPQRIVVYICHSNDHCCPLPFKLHCGKVWVHTFIVLDIQATLQNGETSI